MAAQLCSCEEFAQLIGGANAEHALCRTTRPSCRCDARKHRSRPLRAPVSRWKWKPGSPVPAVPSLSAGESDRAAVPSASFQISIDQSPSTSSWYGGTAGDLFPIEHRAAEAKNACGPPCTGATRYNPAGLMPVGSAACSPPPRPQVSTTILFRHTLRSHDRTAKQI